MHPRVVALVVAFVLLCSGCFSPAQAMAAPTQNIESAGDGSLGDVRHHRVGGTVDEGSGNLPAPLEAESAAEPLLPVAVSVPAPSALSFARPNRLGLAALQPPFIEGPQRPPCATRIPA